MATKADFTEEEWDTLHKGVTGAGMYVSSSDADFTDSFGEAKALAKQLVEERTTGTTQLVRELAQTGGTGFGFATSPGKVEAETLEALRSSMALLAAKAPDEQEPYRTLVLEVAQRVADAKGGVTDKETGAIAKVKEALGVAQA
jgi:hypothetical protein